MLFVSISIGAFVILKRFLAFCLVSDTPFYLDA